MPLPIILSIVAGVTALGGAGAGISGAVKMKDANDTLKLAQSKMERCQNTVDSNNKATTAAMDELGKLEINILKSFKEFSDIIERIQNRPEFDEVNIDGAKLPKYDPEKIKNVSMGAGVLAGGIGGAVAGTAGGFAAAGATAAAVAATATASTGVAIGSLSGAAATNATLAALGGGAIAAGGGGMALGATVLGASTLGVGLLVGGIIFNFTGSKLSDKADDAWRQANKAEDEADKICEYLKELRDTASYYNVNLVKINNLYIEHLNRLKKTVIYDGKTDWRTFTREEDLNGKNTVMLVGLLYEMCKVKLVIKTNNSNGINEVNTEVYTEVAKAMKIRDMVA